MNENCKYCDYVSKCMRKCEYNSLLCKVNRSFPKIVDVPYEELKKQNQKYKEVIDKIRKICSNVPYDWSVCGIDVVHKIENILKEVE